MIEQAIDRVLQLAQIEKKEIDGLIYVRADQNVVRLKRPDQAQIKPLVFNTLTGLSDYIAANIDSLSPTGLTLHVEDFDEISLIGPIDPQNDNERACYATAVSDKKFFRFGQWQPIEDFIINLQTCFAFEPNEGGDAWSIIDLVGKIASEHIRESKDNGFTQTVQVKTGLTTRSEVTVKNPVELYPWRTFAEIEQPLTRAILRFKESREGLPTVALFEPISNQWRLDAIQSIKTWLQNHIEFMPVLA